MNFLKNAASLSGALGGGNAASAEEKVATDAPATSDLLSNAKYLSEVAQHAVRNETDQIDKAKAADAASDLLQAAKGYGLDKQGFGQYIDQADSYLKQYGSGASAPQPDDLPEKAAEKVEAVAEAVPEPAKAAVEELEAPVEKPEAPVEKPEAPIKMPAAGSDTDIGGYVKLAQSFLK